MVKLILRARQTYVILERGQSTVEAAKKTTVYSSFVSGVDSSMFDLPNSCASPKLISVKDQSELDAKLF